MSGFEEMIWKIMLYFAVSSPQESFEDSWRGRTITTMGMSEALVWKSINHCLVNTLASYLVKFKAMERPAKTIACSPIHHQPRDRSL